MSKPTDYAMQSEMDKLQTNDQVLSLTDQLNLGVRMIELDTHWFDVSVSNPTSQSMRVRVGLGLFKRDLLAHSEFAVN